MASDALHLPTLSLPFLFSLIAGSRDIGFLGQNGCSRPTSPATWSSWSLTSSTAIPRSFRMFCRSRVFVLVLLLICLFASSPERTGAQRPPPLELLLWLPFCYLASPADNGSMRTQESQLPQASSALQRGRANRARADLPA